MSLLEFQRSTGRDRLGLKGPLAAQWLAARGIGVPAAPNTWTAGGADADAGEALLVARLGSAEFFLEDSAGGTRLRALDLTPETAPPGVYPVLREDRGFSLSGDGAVEVLAQVCNINFADLDGPSRPVIMTLMIGVSVLVILENEAAQRRFRIWCDPTFGEYLEESLGAVVIESGGKLRGVWE
jgi:sarcosine oxidase subunit gamma